MYSVVIADGQELFRLGLRSLLSARDDVRLVRDTGSGREAIVLVQELDADLLILDVTLPDMDGIALVHDLARRGVSPEILFITDDDDERTIRLALGAGARGYLSRRDPGSRVMEAIEALLSRQPYISETVASGIGSSSQPEEPLQIRHREPGALTGRETDVLLLVVQGQSNRQIADQLAIGIKTVETHRAAIMRKLELRTMPELVRYAIRAGLIRV